VPIGTDIFVRDLVAKTCRDIIDDVEKLDSIQDLSITIYPLYQFLRFVGPHAYNKLILTLCLITVVSCSNRM
jgi:hypothetical protein